MYTISFRSNYIGVTLSVEETRIIVGAAFGVQLRTFRHVRVVKVRVWNMQLIFCKR